MAGRDALIWRGPFDGYEVQRDGKRIGWVMQVARGEWVANYKDDGCFCHWVHATRREAVASLIEPSAYVEGKA